MASRSWRLRVGSIGESVTDGETGFLTEPLDEAQTAERLAELFADPRLAERMGRPGAPWSRPAGRSTAWSTATRN